MIPELQGKPQKLTPKGSEKGRYKFDYEAVPSMSGNKVWRR